MLLELDAGTTGSADGLGDPEDWGMLWDRDTQGSEGATGLGSWGVPLSGPVVVVGQVSHVRWDECPDPDPWLPAPGS